jgi:small subunit ribosomal protein S3Ae
MANPKKGKVVDKWKAKTWFQVLAPAVFENKEIAEIVANEDKTLVGRVVKVSLMDAAGTGSQNAMFTMLKFRVTDVKGHNANTKLIGYEIMPTYLKTLVRRNKSLIHASVPVKTKEDQTVYVKVIAVTGSKVSQNTKKNLRNSLVDEVKKGTDGMGYDQLMQEVIYGRLTAKLFGRLKTITPMKRVEVRKCELTEQFK